jgi:carbamoyl-phosphate synthase small subunit
VSRRRNAVADREAFFLERQLHLYASEMYSYAPMSRAAVLGLEDGSVWWGEAFGDASSASGEVVFNTAMTGYQEVASDASYNGQIVVMTYPLIGNYGVFDRAAESRKPWVEALVVRELNATCREGTDDLDSYLRTHGVPGIAGIDTRALTRRLRSSGTLRGALIQVPPHRALDPDIGTEAIAKARATTALALRPLVAEASVSTERTVGAGPKIALIDTGVKENQVRSLVQRGAAVRVYPVDSSMRDLLSWSPDAVVITNGPGDPAAIPHVAANVKILLDMAQSRGSGRPVPILGICLGHQLLARAIGASTSRLPFGHHGSNHPVQDTVTGQVVITSQNHEFQVDETSLPLHSAFFVSKRNLNDGSVEGLAHRTLPIRTYQYHPEGAPGPRDNEPVFDRFMDDVRDAVARRS